MAAAAFVSNALLLGRPSPSRRERSPPAPPPSRELSERRQLSVRKRPSARPPSDAHPGLAARALDLRGHASVLTRAFDDAAPEPSPEPAAASPVDDADASPSTPPPPDDASAAPRRRHRPHLR